KGCPEIKEEVKEALELATRSVRFASGSDNLLSGSYRILNEVAQIMIDYPQYKLRISGHTDSSGDDQKNLELSKRRAASCLKYLAGKGVDASRMTSDGFGETQPIGNNKTSTGRAQNRRVEFNLFVD
ncbi:MAG: OmpA family protein, partial [Bacteroidota bacterium]